MDFFENPYYRMNKILLTYLGQWPLQSARSRFFFQSLSILLVGSILVPKIIRFVEYFGDLGGMIRCLPVLGLHGLTVIFFCTCTLNVKKFKVLVYRIRDDWTTKIEDMDSKNLKRFAERGRLLTIAYTVYIYATLWTYLLVPLIPIAMDVLMPLNKSRERIFLYETEYFVDQDKYYFFILIHAYVTMPVSLAMTIAFDTMFAVYVHHACGIFTTLGLRLESIGGGNPRDNSEIEQNTTEERDVAYEEIVSCVKLHRDATEFARLIESSTSLCLLFVFGLALLMITMTGFMTVTKLDHISEALRFGSFTMAEITHVFYICWQGQMMMDHSHNIFLHAYNVNWYDISPRAQKLLILIMMRSSEPCKITAGKVYVLSLENFSTILKTSASYFTVLLSMQ